MMLSAAYQVQLTSKESSGNGRTLQAKRFAGCQLSNANGQNETEILIFKKNINKKFVKDL